jgi:cyclase
VLKKRLIPKLLIRNQLLGKVSVPVLVTTKQFGQERRVGDPKSQAKIYEAQLADELIVLDIDSNPISANSTFVTLLTELASETFMPLTVGGGVRSVDDYDILLGSGADKISINAAALKEPTLIDQAAKRFGAQCVVVSVDFRTEDNGIPSLYTERGQTKWQRPLADWVKEAVNRGAGEVVLTDIDADGSGEGLNIKICEEIASSVGVPIILSGGCGVAQHFVDGFKVGKADGCAAGTYFCFRDQNPMQTRSHIANAGINVRMLT